MSGGGDTPKNTLWAYEYEHGNYVLGSLNNGVLKIECETDSADLWVVDAEGVYRDNIAMSSGLESDVVDAINAKYDTDFTELTMMQVSGIAIGDDCPNWEEYEKILIQLEDGYYKFDLSNGAGRAFACMKVQDGNVEIYASSLDAGSNINVYSDAGIFNAANGAETIITSVQGICSEYPNFGSVSKYVKGNSNLENWSEYTLLS